MAKAQRYKETSGGLVEVDRLTGKPLKDSYTEQTTIEGGVPIRNYEQINPQGYYGTPQNPFPEAGKASAREPAVVSNVSILQDTIPSLQQRASQLPTYGAQDQGSAIGEGGDEYSFDEIIGLGEDPKHIIDTIS